MHKIEINTPELPFSVEEALNKLRINIKFCGDDKKKLIISSSNPDEGKSVIAVQLWKMLAEAGFPTVLVDLDLRKSVFMDRYKIDHNAEKKDIIYYLSGMAKYEEIVYSTNLENGFIVPVFTTLENPSILLENKKLPEVLDKLAETYRYVIVDSPPLQNVADGSLIASACDGAILVVRCGITSKREISDSIKQINISNCPLLGVVLNRAEVKNKIYKKYYSKSSYGGYYH